jgi:hypothetical protein
MSKPSKLNCREIITAGAKASLVMLLPYPSFCNGPLSLIRQRRVLLTMTRRIA